MWTNYSPLPLKHTVQGRLQNFQPTGIVDTAPPHMPTWEQLQARVSRPLVRPMWVVRPNPPPPDEEEEEDEDEEDSGSDGESRPAAREPLPPPMNRSVMLPVFHHLSVKDLRVVMQVCRSWAQWAIHPSLWKTIRLTHKRLNVNHLMGVVRRQPNSLHLSWARVTKEQLSWLLARLPQLHELHLEGQSWQTISCLTSPYCPPLSILDLSFCEGLTDATLSALLSSPRTHRPGHRDTTTRLKQLTELRLAGTQVGDEGVRSIVRSLPFLSVLNLNSCLHITEMAAALLAHPSSVVSHSLSSLDLRGCHRLAPTCLPSLKCLPLLAKLALHPCSRIPLKALRVWGKYHGYTMVADEILTRAPPPPPDPTDEPMSDSEISSLSRSSSPGTTSEAKPTPDELKATQDTKAEPEKDKIASEGTQKDIDSKAKSASGGDEQSNKKAKDEPLKTSAIKTSAIDTSAKEKSENTKGDGNKDGRKSTSHSVESSKVGENQMSASVKAETNSSSSGGIRVSTRRQSRLLECDSDSSSNITEAEKTNTEQNSKKAQSEVKNEKNVSQSEQIGKKSKTSSIEQSSTTKSSVSQEKNKEKSNAKESPSSKVSLNRKDSKTTLYETNRKEPLPSQPSASEKCATSQQVKKSEVIAKKDSEKATSTSILGRSTRPLSVQVAKTDKISSEQIIKSENASQDSKKEEALSQGNKRESQGTNKSTAENKKESQGTHKSNATVPDKGSKKSSSESSSAKVATSSKDSQKERNSSTETSKKLPVSGAEQTHTQNLPVTTTGPIKRMADSPDQPSKKIAISSEALSKKTDSTDSDKKKSADKKGTTTQGSKSSDSQMNQKNVIVTSVEVHRAENYDGSPDSESSMKRSERRLSVRRSKDDQDVKTDEKADRNERMSTDSSKDKRRDSKTREEEMNRITVEDSLDKDSKHSKKRTEDKDKKASSSKKVTIKQNCQTPVKIKQEKDIVTRSTKRLKSEKEVEEKQAEQTKEESSPKPPEKFQDVRKNYRKSKDAQDDKDELGGEESEKKDIKSPKPVSVRKDKESIIGKTPEKREDDKANRRSRNETEEYMSKLRRKSHDSDGSSDLSSVDVAKKEESAEEKIRSRRRSVRDEDTPRGSLEKKLKEEFKEEKKADAIETVAKGMKNTGDMESTTKQAKRKNEDADETELTNKKMKDDSEDGSKTAKKPETMRERSGSRERPERAHRSPRRLSMCQ